MKRVFSLLFLILLYNGCDDGNLTLETINFDEITAQNCGNNIFYKLKETEALLLEIPRTVFVNEPTPIDKPLVIDIDDSINRVVYSFYNGKVAAENICKTISPALPLVSKQWIAISGKIEITTTTITKPGKIEGSTQITGYKHRIIFKNITFDKGNGTQVYETFIFGDYTTSATLLPFEFLGKLNQCATSKDLYDFTTGTSLSIENLDPSLIANVETPLNSPRTALIEATKNKLVYRIYTNGILQSNYFCNTVIPTTPRVSEEWNAITGVNGVSGIIEVSTIKGGNTAFKHTIVIKKATLKNGNSSFKLGDVYNYGELTTL